MIAAGFALIGALAALAGVLHLADDTAAPRRLAVACLVLFAAVGSFVAAEPEGPFKAAVTAVGRGADGLPATSSVTFQQADGGRNVRRVTLERPVPMGAPLLWAAGGLALLLALGGGTRLASGNAGRFGAVAAAVLAGLAGLVLAGGVGGQTGTGEPEVRAVLGTLGLEALGAPTSFTVPDGTWSYRTGNPLPLYGAAALGLALLFVPARSRAWAGGLLAVGAALAAVGPIVDIVMTGGLAWRPATGLLWAVGLLTAGVALEREAPARAGALAGIAAALSLLLI